LGDGLNLFVPILFYTTSLQFPGLRDISVVGVFSTRESTYSIILRGGVWACWSTHSELLYRTGPTSFTRLLFKISLTNKRSCHRILNQQKKLSSHSCTGPKMATTYFALVHSLTARSNELTHHSKLKGMMEFRKEECPQSHAPL
jgi:hypothetical protein